MTLIELQEVLGDSISKVNDNSVDAKTRARIMENADTTARLAKQMINNADVVLRTDKLIAEGKLKDDAKVRQLIGN